MKTIYEFKNGDEVVRIEPAKDLSNILGETIRDRSYVGEKMIFVGIANGVIYLKPTERLSIFFSAEGFIDLPLDIWDEGWDHWVDPKTLLGDENNYLNNLDERQIKSKLSQAVAEENYELADKLQKLLKDEKK